MPVAALRAAIWTNPKPPILLLLHSIKKVLANLQKKIISKIIILLKNTNALRMGKQR